MARFPVKVGGTGEAGVRHKQVLPQNVSRGEGPAIPEVRDKVPLLPKYTTDGSRNRSPGRDGFNSIAASKGSYPTINGYAEEGPTEDHVRRAARESKRG